MASACTVTCIPRVFHHIWFGDRPLPEQFRHYIDSWREFHPNWEFRLWRDEDLFPLENQVEFDAATQLAQKVDIARYEILYRFGGIYLDTDFECLRCIDSLLGGIEGFAAREDEQTIAIGLMGAKPQHPLFADVVRALPEWFTREGNTCQTTGP